MIPPGKYGHRLTREMYALVNKKASSRFPREMYSDALWTAEAWAFEDEEHTLLSDEYCTLQRTAALENFDLSMAFFAHLSPERLEEALIEMLRKHKYLRPVTDLALSRRISTEKCVYGSRTVSAPARPGKGTR